MKISSTLLQAVACGACVVTAGVSCIPETLGLSWIRDVNAEYQNGKQVVPSKEMLELVEKVKDDILLPVEEEAGIEVFTSNQIEPIHKGSTKMVTGCLLGFPSSMNYTKSEEVIQNKYRIRGKTIDWDSEEGAEIAASMLLSAKAKQFLVAREVFYGSNMHVWVKTGLRGIYLTGTWYACVQLTNMFQLQQRMKLWGRAGLYSIISLGFGVVYVFMSDLYNCAKDRKADEKAARLGKDYAEGGVEYYSKVLQRNKAFRKMLGAEGKQVYTMYGNEIETIRSSKVGPVARQDSLIQYLKEYDEKESKGNNTDSTS